MLYFTFFSQKKFKPHPYNFGEIKILVVNSEKIVEKRQTNCVKTVDPYRNPLKVSACT
jgi:hypothetical protein